MLVTLHTATSIAPSLAKLFNISIKLGCFPTCWKTSSVIPVPKSSKHNEVANYRPISLLPVVSKLLERHIHRAITTHLNEIRPLKALESRHNVCSVFLDLRKAFDSVPHRLLLEKLNTYICTGFPHPLMATQLPCRKKTTCGHWR